MSHPNPPAEDVVIMTGPLKPLNANPNPFNISDLLQTRHCLPGSVLLVESIESEIAISDKSRAVRLLLGDGELCIQALLWPELHRLVNGRTPQLSVGCYVQLNKFELRSILVSNVRYGAAEEEEEEEKEDGVDSEGDEMVFLVVRDLRIVGYNAAYMQMIEQTHLTDLNGDGGSVQANPRSKAVQGDAAAQDVGEEASFSRGAPEEGLAKTDAQITASEPVPQQHMHHHHQPTPNTRLQSYQSAKNHPVPSTAPAPAMPAAAAAETTNPRPASSTLTRTNSLNRNPSQPFKLTPLKSIPNLPYKQNWVVNVLAIVASLSPLELAILPPNKQPFKQRTARLVDPSTSKQVLLTVFLDPDEFAPTVGSVVLLLALKNHRFDGGSLKKYANERPREGGTWWVENPRGVEGCDVEGLERWWAEKNL